MSITRYHAELTKVDNEKNEYVIYPKTTVGDVYTDSKNGISIEGKLNSFGICTTSLAFTEKVVTIPGFKLVDKCIIAVQFTYPPITGNTLKINDNIAYAMKFSEGFLGYNGIIIQFIFDELSKKFIGIENSGRIGVAESTSSQNSQKLYLIGVGELGTAHTSLQSDPTVYVKDSILYASKFNGNGSAITNINATNISIGTISSNRFPTVDGLSAGSYGITSDSTSVKIVGSGEVELTMPAFTVDIKGRITSAANRKVLFSADLYKVRAKTPTTEDSKSYLLTYDNVTNGGNAATPNIHTGLYWHWNSHKLQIPGSVNCSAVSTNAIYAYDGDSLTTWITPTKYNGQSATTASITEHISDSVESSSKAFSSAAGVSLRNRVSTLESGTQRKIVGAATTITTSNLTSGRVLISNDSGKVSVSDITTTKLGYLSNVSSDIQGQFSTLSSSIESTKTDIQGQFSTLSSSIESTKTSLTSQINSVSTSLSTTQTNLTKLTSTVTTMNNNIGAFYEASHEEGAVRADKEWWVTQAKVLLPPGTYVIRVSVHGRWKGYRSNLWIAYSNDNMESYTYLSQSKLADNEKDMDHLITLTDIRRFTKNTYIFPYFCEDVSDGGYYGESNKYTLTFRVRAVRIK